MADQYVNPYEHMSESPGDAPRKSPQEEKKDLEDAQKEALHKLYGGIGAKEAAKSPDEKKQDEEEARKAEMEKLKKLEEMAEDAHDDGLITSKEVKEIDQVDESPSDRIEKAKKTLAEAHHFKEIKKKFSIHTKADTVVDATITDMKDHKNPGFEELGDFINGLETKKTLPEFITLRTDVELGGGPNSTIRDLKFDIPVSEFLSSSFEIVFEAKVKRLIDLALFAQQEYMKKAQEEPEEKEAETKSEETESEDEKTSKDEEDTDKLEKAGIVKSGKGRILEQFSAPLDGGVSRPVGFSVNGGQVWGVVDMDSAESNIEKIDESTQ